MKRRNGNILALLSTGPIENNPILDIRPTKTVTVKIVNRSDIDTSVAIQGFILGASRSTYMNEVLDIEPIGVLTKIYFADVDAFDFIFTASEAIRGKVVFPFGKKRNRGSW